MTTTTKMPDETRLSEIVLSDRPAKHLAANGYETLGDVRQKGMAGVLGIKYVGPVSVSAIRAAIGPQEEEKGPDPVPTTESDEPEFEEGPFPVHLERLPRGPMRMSWCAANKVAQPGGGYRLQRPIWIEFDARDGRAKVTQKMYWMRHFNRNEDKVNAAIEEDRPWRQACADMIRRDFSSHGTTFILLAD